MKNKLEKTFKMLENQFDIQEPNIGHFNRFEQKLKAPRKKIFKSWIKYSSIAAIFLLFIGIAFIYINANKEIQLADISPKMEETQFYFSSVIKEEMSKVKKMQTPENKQIVEDALAQINYLETNYKSLCVELKKSENSKQLLVAMIANFNQRIEVLQNLLLELNKHKQIKTTNYEI